MDNHAWDLLKFLFIEAGETINLRATFDLIQVMETNEILLGKNRQTLKQGASRSHIQRMFLYDKDFTKKRDEIPPQVINVHVRKLRDEIVFVRQQIEANVPAPIDVTIWEYTCFVVRQTILNDNWYELKEKTRNRGFFVQIAFTIFFLEIHYRYWARSFLISKEPAPDSQDIPPIWGTCVDFLGDAWFAVLQDEDKLAPVKKWGPMKVYRAMNTLMRQRQMGQTNITSTAAVFVFSDYRHALFDRLAELILFPIDGKPKELNDSAKGSKWFGLRSTAELREDINIGHQGDVHAIAREIKKRQNEELRKKQEQLMVQGEEVKSTIIPKEVRWNIMMQNSDAAQLKDLRVHLFQKQSQLEELRKFSTPSEIDDAYLHDKQLAQELERDIADITERLKGYQDIHEKRLREEMVRKLEGAKSLAASSSTANVVFYKSEPKLSFLNEVMLLHDHLMVWQFPIGEKCRCFTSEHLALKFVFMREIPAKLMLTTEATFLQNCHTWIIGRDITFPEREAYRQSYSDTVNFSTMQVCEFRRSREETKLEDFPIDLTELLQNRENVYYHQAWTYFIWWYLLQVCARMKNIDATIYHWEIEEMCSSLKRVPLRNPVMGRIGADWIVMKGGRWTLDNGQLNGIWCGKDPLDALVCWCYLAKESGFVIVDRDTNIEHDLSSSQLQILLDEAARATAINLNGHTDGVDTGMGSNA
jgi:hypothetical protein